MDHHYVNKNFKIMLYRGKIKKNLIIIIIAPINSFNVYVRQVKKVVLIVKVNYLILYAKQQCHVKASKNATTLYTNIQFKKLSNYEYAYCKACPHSSLIFMIKKSK